MAVRSRDSSSSVRSLPPPCPKSPPEYPDLYGKRRETAKIQMLEREISFLEGYGFCDGEIRSTDTYEPEESEVTSVLEVALVPFSWASFLLEFPALTCHGSAVAAIPGPANAARQITVLANAARLTRVHASAAHVTAVHVNAAHVTAVHVNAAHVTAVHVNAAPATAVLVNAAARATAVHSQNGDASAVHATAVHVQAAAQSRNANVSRVLNPVAAAETVAFFNSLHARIAFAANGNVLPLNVRR
ncbi:hypothetical protein F3Y22_tig00111402pilonHSYRG00175 [Hibiscus syriacus]|uniref:Uncharacterized protein n=1 Tax=Hibiscus syriacus TaxID=106335 RepID=A0A6A2YL34_HIBSY|nr:hypothetical protein F3Y22_tig00111402pilonHSYRG00175 [Hibiscus syriacus]